MEKFVIIPKEDKGVTMTIRIDRALQERYNELSAKTNRSRNELICMALQYALDNMEIQDKQQTDKRELLDSSVGSLLYIILDTRLVQKEIPPICSPLSSSVSQNYVRIYSLSQNFGSVLTTLKYQ